MSYGNQPYRSACRQDIPYPSVSHESVPSLIDNLVTALYGAFYNPITGTGYIQKKVINQQVAPIEITQPAPWATTQAV